MIMTNLMMDEYNYANHYEDYGQTVKKIDQLKIFARVISCHQVGQQEFQTLADKKMRRWENLNGLLKHLNNM